MALKLLLYKAYLFSNISVSIPNILTYFNAVLIGVFKNIRAISEKLYFVIWVGGVSDTKRHFCVILN